MKFIIEQYDVSNGWAKFGEACQKAGHGVIHARPDQLSKIVAMDDLKGAFVIGSFQAVTEARTVNNKLVVWSSLRSFDCSAYYPDVGHLLINGHYAFLQIKELLRQRWEVWRTFGKDTKVFVRPDRSDKPFTGEVIDLQELDSFFKQVSDDRQMVVISTPKEIRGEWRFVASKDKLLGCSSYKYQGNLTYIPFAPKQVVTMANKVRETITFPDPLVVIDIAELEDGTVGLMELNGFSTSGMYAIADKPEEIISFISNYKQEI